MAEIQRTVRLEQQGDKPADLETDGVGSTRGPKIKSDHPSVVMFKRDAAGGITDRMRHQRRLRKLIAS